MSRYVVLCVSFRFFLFLLFLLFLFVSDLVDQVIYVLDCTFSAGIFYVYMNSDTILSDRMTLKNTGKRRAHILNMPGT